MQIRKIRKIRKTLIVKTLLMHKICAKYLVVSWKIFQQSLSNFWICCTTACLNLNKSYTCISQIIYETNTGHGSIDYILSGAFS